ncbi:MAG TPA: glycosyltransferase family 2 protein [Chthoniobacterales bacterium]|nr:glycosyltransferase family 2 protein [Chthoniobacterales bacterium]
MSHATHHCSGPIAIIIPACDEEECIGVVLDELSAVLDRDRFVVAVGVNDSQDRTAAVARAHGALVAETPQRGYGYGCQAAIDLVRQTIPGVRAYIFVAGDAASDPRDIAALVTAYEQGYTLVLGARTGMVRNWRAMRFSHVIANFAVALWCGILAGRPYRDLAPLRLIDRDLFESIAPQEMTFGWTIEPQIAAARLGAPICEVCATERPRLAGKQKVSGVSWYRTFTIGCRILAAGLRTRLRFRSKPQFAPCLPDKPLLAQPQRGL